MYGGNKARMRKAREEMEKEENLLYRENLNINPTAGKSNYLSFILLPTDSFGQPVRACFHPWIHTKHAPPPSFVYFIPSVQYVRRRSKGTDTTMKAFSRDVGNPCFFSPIKLSSFSSWQENGNANVDNCSFVSSIRDKSIDQLYDNREGRTFEQGKRASRRFDSTKMNEFWPSTPLCKFIEIHLLWITIRY